MRIDVDACRDPDLLAGEVRRLQAVIESGQPTLTDLQREVVEYGVLLCDATAGMANDRATIDGASRAADVLRGLLGRKERDDMTTPDDTPEPSLASAGSQPVAWGNEDDDGIYEVGLSEANADYVCERAANGKYSHRNPRIVPLYRHPQPTLTDEERDVLDRLAHDASYRRMEWTERVLRGVLERLG
jgi:hypothetical protein